MFLPWGVASYHGQPFFSGVCSPPNQTYFKMDIQAHSERHSSFGQ